MKPNRFLSFLKKIFSAIRGKTLDVARQVLRFFLFPIARKRRKMLGKGLVDRLIAWSEIGEPEDPEDKRILFWERWYAFFTFLWIFAASLLMLVVFGNPIPRAIASFNYLFEAWKYIFQYLFTEDPSSIPIPAVSNQTALEFEWIEATIRSFWFYFQVGVNGIANLDVAKEWAIGLSNRIIDFVKVATWIPIVIMLFKMAGIILVAEHPNDDGGDSEALQLWDRLIVRKVFWPVRDVATDYKGWLSVHSGAVKKAVLLISAAICVYGWTAMDFVTSYFMMLMTFTFDWFPVFLSSSVIDAINVFARIGIPGAVLIGCQVAWRANVRSALAELRSMQAQNEEIAASLPVVTAINGPVGVGKTTMVSSIAVDAESHFREYYLSVIMKYEAAFPKFSWERLETWIRMKCSDDASGRLETRAKIKEGLKALWDGWLDNGFAQRLPNGNEAFFGYDPGNGLRFFDGAKEIALIDAVMSYAESYFMYFPGKKLVTSNYPIAMDGYQGGTFFPVYPSAGSYLNGPCRVPRMPKAYSTIFNEDFFRIKAAVNPGDRSKDASIDGGVIAMTEGSNERGNKNDYAGMSRKDEKANKVNDGWNQAMRLIRHWFTVDGMPVCNFIYDYQRGDAMNADQREAAEDTIFIMERSEEQNALPLWWLVDYVTEWIQTKWQNYYFRSWRANRNKGTLANRILGRFCGFFINLRQRLRFSYGYQVAVFNREHGGGNGLTGQRTMEQYFFIFRKVRGELFNSGVYAPILEQRSISAKSGWLDMPTFSSVEATPEEFGMENSFFIRDISSLFDSRAASKASERIRMAASEGTEIPDADPEGAEEAPEEPETAQEGGEGNAEEEKPTT